MIRIHDTQKSAEFITNVPGALMFDDKKGHFNYGVSTPPGYSEVPKEYIERALAEIEEIIPLHWCDLDIYSLPLLMLTYNEISQQITGMTLFGQSWEGCITLGARYGKVEYEEVASTLLHEIAHEIHYRFIDKVPFDFNDTEIYKTVKKLLKIENYKELSNLWEERPVEIIADTVRFFTGLKNPVFNHAPYTIYNGKTKPQKAAYDYILSLIPQKAEEDKGGNEMVDTKKDYFKDDNGKWHEQFNNELAALGILDGDGNGNFRPNDTVTRAELSKVAAVLRNNILNEVREMLGK